MSGVEFADEVKYYKPPRSYKLKRKHVIQLSSRVGQLGVVDGADAVARVLEFQDKPIKNPEREKLSLLSAHDKMSTLQSISNLSSHQYYFWSSILYQIAVRTPFDSQKEYLNSALARLKRIPPEEYTFYIYYL
eukprot:TRINITY_DN25149_c0_g1_i1.p1 TRINITY_DN25149_c0_g1~~TRINITY_DN25149_c0_g1_i1.p1  ORF type:complete len:133 (-),score=18.50 TRINITY_DN25149_c0_g1_i1:123-521(-)